MNRTLLIVGGIVVIVLGIGVFGSMFIVPQTEQAIVLQFGDPKRVVKDPGLHFKIPVVQNVEYYERRVLGLQPPSEQVILADQKRLNVDTFLRYRIVNPLDFRKTVNNEITGRQRLSDILISSMRRVLGRATLLTVLSEEREGLMSSIQDEVNRQSQAFGVNILDVRIRRADLPDQAAQAIFARMRSEREREAREARAQGYERSQQIRAGADRERTVLLAEADKNSEILRGEGDREAIRIYAKSFGQDPEFFRFYRSMQAYRKALSGSDTTMVLSPDSEFFRFFNHVGGKELTGPEPPATQPAK